MKALFRHTDGTRTWLHHFTRAAYTSGQIRPCYAASCGKGLPVHATVPHFRCVNPSHGNTIISHEAAVWLRPWTPSERASVWLNRVVASDLWRAQNPACVLYEGISGEIRPQPQGIFWAWGQKEEGWGKRETPLIMDNSMLITAYCAVYTECYLRFVTCTLYSNSQNYVIKKYCKVMTWVIIFDF